MTKEELTSNQGLAQAMRNQGFEEVYPSISTLYYDVTVMVGDYVYEIEGNTPEEVLADATREYEWRHEAIQQWDFTNITDPEFLGEELITEKMLNGVREWIADMEAAKDGRKE